MGLFPFCLPASFEWSSSSRLRLSAEERAEENWGNHQFENTLGEIRNVAKKNYGNNENSTTWIYRISSLYDKWSVMRFYNHFFMTFSENFEVFQYFCSLSAQLFEYFFLCSESEKRYSDAFLVAISCSFGSHGEKGVFWVVMFLYTGNCGYVLIVEFRLYSSFVSFVSFSIL